MPSHFKFRPVVEKKVKKKFKLWKKDTQKLITIAHLEAALSCNT